LVPLRRFVAEIIDLSFFVLWKRAKHLLCQFKKSFGMRDLSVGFCPGQFRPQPIVTGVSTIYAIKKVAVKIPLARGLSSQSALQRPQ
jgi:hypothetical protein